MENALTESPRTTAATYRRRLDRLRADIESGGWSALLVLDGTDIAYLTGLQRSIAALVVGADEAWIATDFRYVAKARSLGTGTQVHQLDQGLFTDLGARLAEWSGGGVVAYDPSSLSHKAFRQLTEHLAGGITLRDAGGAVSKLRRVKDDAELDAIRRASALLEGAYEMVAETGFAGATEREVVWRIEKHLREAGASAMSFDAIVASGPNGAFPHHSPGERVIGRGELVTIDIGCVVDGYCSDCTRTFATGELGDDLQKLYDVTLEAQLAGLDAVRAGVDGRDADAASRAIIDAAGFGEHFGHGLGHGVGMQVHEAPRLARTSNDTLAPKEVVTVEPGIYVPELGGVRIEDLVIVTDDGCEILTHYTKSLVTVEG